MYRMTKYIILIAFLYFESYLSAQIKHDVKKSQQIYDVKKSQTKYNVKESQQIYDVKDSVKIFFRQGKINLDPTLSDNQWALNRIADTPLTSCEKSSSWAPPHPRVLRESTGGYPKSEPMCSSTIFRNTPPYPIR